MLMAGTRISVNSRDGVEGSHADVCVREGGCTAKNIRLAQELEKSYRLRHQIFAEELKWLPASVVRMETDDYDSNAIPFGVFDESNGLAAYLRLILTGKPFMLENEFRFLIGDGHEIRRESDTAEVSRLCVAPFARNKTISGNFGLHGTSMLLLKAVYLWCKRNSIRYLYAVTEMKIQRLYYAKGFPFRLIGEPRTMPDGILVAAMIMDWREFEESNSRKRPGLFKWFSLTQSGQGQGLLQQHGCSSQHPAFV